MPLRGIGPRIGPATAASQSVGVIHELPLHTFAKKGRLPTGPTFSAPGCFVGLLPWGSPEPLVQGHRQAFHHRAFSPPGPSSLPKQPFDVQPSSGPEV